MQHFIYRYGASVDQSIAKLKKVPWWSYWVKSSDANFAKRQDKSVDFFEFDSDQNFQIEMFYKECCEGVNRQFGDRFTIVGDQLMKQTGHTYQVWGESKDPSTWVEQNVTLAGAPQRQLRRVLKELPDEGDSQFGMIAFVMVEEEKEEANSDSIFDQIKNSDDSDNEEESKEGAINYKTQSIVIEGVPSEIAQLKQLVHSYSQVPRNFISYVDFDGIAAPDFIQALQTETKSRFKISELVVEGARIKITGFQCNQARRFVKKALVFRAKYAKFQTYPKHWEEVHIMENDLTIIKEVHNQSNEFNAIQVEFLKTMANKEIIKVERIQNPKLWQKFHVETNQLAKKLQSKQGVNIRYLYHGTRQNPPRNIYQSEQGFNANYSSEGMWGRAIYFATRSSYSDDYHYKLPDGSFQMFYARVILGKSKEMAMDRGLREPPLLEGSQFERYDSVQGFTNNTPVFMVYSNSKAYPEYLITYRDKP
ncbi:hypothetical protein FGO68_gene8464 [Halteria grandinella]|uniref:Poly [ADP-ribose] polymerase n=1 Tax=Halteria grandinella TaxID=5974 RepID=A0A8J8T7L9_HALGN|nr:hypothetical protein FGO68_gene8464 [Halteria grandinella]